MTEAVANVSSVTASLPLAQLLHRDQADMALAKLTDDLQQFLDAHA